jgi:hypothetical protein
MCIAYGIETYACAICRRADCILCSRQAVDIDEDGEPVCKDHLNHAAVSESARCGPTRLEEAASTRFDSGVPS